MDRKVYKQAELKKMGLTSIVTEAGEEWKELMDEYVRKHGDVGTCVIGAGIAMEIVPPKCRNARITIVVNPSDITPCQGASVWEASVQKIIAKYFTKNGIHAFYYPGRMD